MFEKYFIDDDFIYLDFNCDMEDYIKWTNSDYCPED